MKSQLASISYKIIIDGSVFSQDYFFAVIQFNCFFVFKKVFKIRNRKIIIFIFFDYFIFITNFPYPQIIRKVFSVLAWLHKIVYETGGIIPANWLAFSSQSFF